jgi:hypothetical protein
MASGHVHRANEHMAAPTNAATSRFSLPTRSRPHMAHRNRNPCPTGCRDQGKSGLVVLTVNFVARDPSATSGRPGRVVAND